MLKKSSSKPSTSRTLVTFLLDRTGSMQSIKDDTIGAFNAYLEGLQKEGDGIEFTLVQFDSMSLDKICVALRVKNAKPLTDASYQPRASTPLIDAAYKTIKAVETSLGNDKGKTKVVICIQTDGQENCSTEHTWDELNALIKEKSGLGWQFNFMGCGIDAYEQGQKMGIDAMSTMSYDRTNREATKAAFAASASNTTGFARGRLSSTEYSMSQRSAAKDAWAHKAAGSPSLAPPPSARAPQPKPAAKAPIVDDLVL